MGEEKASLLPERCGTQGGLQSATDGTGAVRSWVLLQLDLVGTPGAAALLRHTPQLSYLAHHTHTSVSTHVCTQQCRPVKRSSFVCYYFLARIY